MLIKRNLVNMTVRYKLHRAKRTQFSALSSISVLYTRHRSVNFEGSHEWAPLMLGYIIHHVLSRKWRELKMRSTLSQLRHSSFFAELELSKCACRLDIDSDSDGLQCKGGPWGPGRGRLHDRRSNFSVTFGVSWYKDNIQKISEFFSQNILDMDCKSALSSDLSPND